MRAAEREIRRLSRAAAPGEACGLLVGEAVVPGRNLSGRPDEFSLDPEAWVEADMLGEVTAVWHSHPEGPAKFSPADVRACAGLGLPWVLYSLPEDRFLSIRPGGGDALTMREFAWGVRDCSTLVADYYRQVLGVFLVVPGYPEGFWRGDHVPILECFLAQGFREVPREGLRGHDVILFHVAGAPPDRPNHCAVYVGGNMILQHLDRCLSGRHSYGPFWRAATTHVLRHGSLA